MGATIRAGRLVAHQGELIPEVHHQDGQAALLGRRKLHQGLHQAAGPSHRRLLCHPVCLPCRPAQHRPRNTLFNQVHLPQARQHGTTEDILLDIILILMLLQGMYSLRHIFTAPPHMRTTQPLASLHRHRGTLYILLHQRLAMVNCRPERTTTMDTDEAP